MKPSLLVVDDKSSMIGLVVRVLEGLVQVVPAGTVREALAVLSRESVAAVLCDLRLPDGDGLQVLRAIRASASPPPFILMTAYASIETAVAATKGGAYDYLTKPFEPEALRALVEAALATSAALPASNDPAGLGPLLGRSPKMRAVFKLIERIAPSDVNVLLTGETGTGKELVARAIHQLSGRGEKPFFAINCASIPRDLLEGELFGQLRAAVTPDASTERAGLFEVAHGSTLLLDEVGDMRIPMQAKVTRVLESRSVRRVGDAEERTFDTRIVATTNRDLRAMVKDSRFREDLWFRLNRCCIELPPLRERPEDIPLLATHFLAERGPIVGSRAASISKAALDLLLAYRWPGNVRELRSVIERAALVEPSEQIDVASLPHEVAEGSSSPSLTDQYLAGVNLREAQEIARDEMNRRYMTVLLREHGGDVALMAAAARVERESIYRLLRKYGLTAGSFREEAPPSRKRPGAE